MEKEKRLIDANELMDKVEGVNWYHIDKLGYLANGANSQDHTPIYKAEDIYNAIRNAPTVDAVPVVHGRWLDNGMCHHKPNRFRNPDKWTIYKCSECGYSNGRRKNANYCPNCGAKMDGGNEDG